MLIAGLHKSAIDDRLTDDRLPARLIVLAADTMESKSNMNNSSKVESAQRSQSDLGSIARRELRSQMSHELRTPMAVIMGFADIIFEETENADIKAHALVIRRNSAKLLQRLNDILDDSESEICNAEPDSAMDNVRLTVQTLGIPPIRAKILLADDLRDVRFVASRILTGSGCRVTVVENGRQAVNAIQRAIDEQEPFDLAILDIQMPELTGTEAVVELRARGVDVSVIALTADATKRTRETLMLAGFSECLSKPIVKHLLLLTIGRLLNIASPG